MSHSRLFLAAFALTSAFAQTPAKPEFEVASIKPSQPFTPGAQGSQGRLNLGIKIDGAQFRGVSLSIRDYLASAYKFKDLRQISGPDWITSDRFDITAKIPEGATREQTSDMLQALLVQRFKIRAHRETKDLPVFALVVAKGGPKVTEVPPDPDEDSKAPVDVQASGGREGTTVNYGRGSVFSFSNGKLEAKKLPMDTFVNILARYLDRPVVNMTELNGKYDFALQFSPEEFMALNIRGAVSAGIVLPPEALRMMEGSESALANAVQTVGLKLDGRKAPMEVLVVDSIEKAPTEN